MGWRSGVPVLQVVALADLRNIAVVRANGLSRSQLLVTTEIRKNTNPKSAERQLHLPSRSWRYR
jgi:hypothetical protein